MSFQLTLQIDDSGSTNVDFDGEVNHMVLVGVLENIKHSVLRTVELQSQAAADAALAEAAHAESFAAQEVQEEEAEGGE